jgi:hypothetical protein
MGTDLNDVYLIEAILNGADLSGANLNGVHLTNANFDRAKVAFTSFVDVDLSTVKGLDTVRHAGPSSIGINAIYRSQGKIPESSCAARRPRELHHLMRSLTGAALDFYSCFIRYSTKDQDFANRLYADLQAKGVRCWFAPHDIQGGKKIHQQIDEAIRIYDKLLLILSEASMNSNWVKTEIANARAKEDQQKRHMLFPISLVPFDCIKAWTLFDADTGLDSACEIREYFVPDFSNWKGHDSYAKAFERLIWDLKADTSRAASNHGDAG